MDNHVDKLPTGPRLGCLSYVRLKSKQERMFLMYHHRITYKPEQDKEEDRIRARFDFLLCVLLFAFVGCLLAWRG